MKLVKKITANILLILITATAPLVAQDSTFSEEKITAVDANAEAIKQKIAVLSGDALEVLDNLEYKLPKYNVQQDAFLDKSEKLMAVLAELLEKNDEDGHDVDIHKIVSSLDESAYFITQITDVLVLKRQTLVETLQSLDKIDSFINSDSDSKELAVAFCDNYPPLCFRESLESSLHKQLHDVEAHLPIFLYLNSIISN